MQTIAIVDYGMGNLRSVAKAFAHVAPDQHVMITANAEEIAAADRVVLPGQAAMPESMAALNASGLRDVLWTASKDRPFFGVCLGLQMLFETTEEGDVPALGYLPGRTVQVARARIVTQPGPVTGHVLPAGLGQCFHGGKALQKARKIRQHSFHLRLL